MRYSILFLILGLASTMPAQTRYFGFFDCHVACMDEVHSFANVAMIRIHIADPKADVALINHAKSDNLKVILSYFPDYLKQSWDHNTPEQQREWMSYVKGVKGSLGDVAAIYPYDEPYWNALGKEGLRREANSVKGRAAVTEEMACLKMATGRIAENLPGIPMIDVEAYPLINDDLRLADGFQWFGFDCYEGYENCNGRSIEDYVSVLKRKIKGTERLVFVMPGFVHVKTGTEPESSQSGALQSILQKEASLVKREPSFIAVLVWSYQVFPQHDGTEIRGFSHLSEGLKSTYKSAGRAVAPK